MRAEYSPVTNDRSERFKPRKPCEAANDPSTTNYRNVASGLGLSTQRSSSTAVWKQAGDVPGKIYKTLMLALHMNSG